MRKERPAADASIDLDVHLSPASACASEAMDDAGSVDAVSGAGFDDIACAIQPIRVDALHPAEQPDAGDLEIDIAPAHDCSVPVVAAPPPAIDLVTTEERRSDTAFEMLRRLRQAVARAVTPACISYGTHGWDTTCENCLPW